MQSFDGEAISPLFDVASRKQRKTSNLKKVMKIGIWVPRNRIRPVFMETKKLIKLKNQLNFYKQIFLKVKKSHKLSTMKKRKTCNFGEKLGVFLVRLCPKTTNITSTAITQKSMKYFLKLHN